MEKEMFEKMPFEDRVEYKLSKIATLSISNRIFLCGVILCMGMFINSAVLGDISLLFVGLGIYFICCMFDVLIDTWFERKLNKKYEKKFELKRCKK